MAEGVRVDPEQPVGVGIGDRGDLVGADVEMVEHGGVPCLISRRWSASRRVGRGSLRLGGPSDGRWRAVGATPEEWPATIRDDARR